MSWTNAIESANNISIHYTRTGGHDLPLLILAHGFSDNGLCWQRTAEEFQGQFDIVMFDARNHGESSRAIASAEAMVEDLAELIKTLDKKPILLGHSMGASTVAGVAAKYPELVEKALLEDPPWWSSAVEERSEEERAAEGEKRRKSFQKYLDDLNSKTDEEVLAYGRELYPDWHDDDLPAWAASKKQLDEGAMDGLSLPNWQEVAGAITVPTLLIHTDGKRDGLLKPEIVAMLKEKNPHLSSVEITEAGHNTRRENFEAYISGVKAFLAS